MSTNKIMTFEYKSLCRLNSNSCGIKQVRDWFPETLILRKIWKLKSVQKSKLFKATEQTAIEDWYNHKFRHTLIIFVIENSMISCVDV